MTCKNCFHYAVCDFKNTIVTDKTRVQDIPADKFKCFVPAADAGKLVKCESQQSNIGFEKNVEKFCDGYCKFPYTCADEDELRDKCESCPICELVEMLEEKNGL